MRVSAISLGIAVAFAAGTAQAQSQCQAIGNQNICTDADGNRSTTQRIGNQIVTSYSDGSSSSSRQIENQSVAQTQQPHLGQPAQIPSALPQTGQRQSFIHRLADRLNTASGGLTYAQMQQLHQQQVDAGALANLAKRQDIAQTGVATAQNAGQLVGGFARGLQSLQAAGSNLDIAAPALAQQMGIPQQQADAILAQAKADPNFLSALVNAENAAANYSNGASAVTQQIGNQRVTKFSNGASAVTQQIGNQTITRYSNGRTVTCQNIGSQRFCNW